MTDKNDNCCYRLLTSRTISTVNNGSLNGNCWARALHGLQATSTYIYGRWLWKWKERRIALRAAQESKWKGLLCRGTHVHHPRLISHKSKRNPLKIGPPLQTGFELYEQSFCIPQPLICLRLLSPGCNIEDATSRENLCDLLKGQKFKTSSFQGHLYH